MANFCFDFCRSYSSRCYSVWNGSKWYITNCSRVIRHAWHFYYAVVLVIKVVYGSIVIACLTP
ncbi:DUF3265 domain-containing protein [Vibrio cholerae]|nr:DUF3265 domain-containing protein [Vibrio cholerae]EGS7961819.1 DUF3265 domain-containing protein [Vibrio cholerae]QKU57438.1 DUF3265 domain-containing protein [Vibrio cholerae]